MPYKRNWYRSVQYPRKNSESDYITSPSVRIPGSPGRSNEYPEGNIESGDGFNEPRHGFNEAGHILNEPKHGFNVPRSEFNESYGRTMLSRDMTRDSLLGYADNSTDMYGGSPGIYMKPPDKIIDSSERIIDQSSIEELSGVKKLPLPSDSEDTSGTIPNSSGYRGLLSLLDDLKRHINIEEIILLGLIILLLVEGVDDVLILIMLAFIILT